MGKLCATARSVATAPQHPQSQAPGGIQRTRLGLSRAIHKHKVVFESLQKGAAWCGLLRLCCLCAKSTGGRLLVLRLFWRGSLARTGQLSWRHCHQPQVMLGQVATAQPRAPCPCQPDRTALGDTFQCPHDPRHTHTVLDSHTICLYAQPYPSAATICPTTPTCTALPPAAAAAAAFPALPFAPHQQHAHPPAAA